MTTTTTATQHERHGHRRVWWLLLAVPVVLGAGFCALRAQASEAGFGFGPPDMGGGPEQHKAFAEKRLDRMLSTVKATDSQRTAIKAIFERMFAEMQPIHEQHQRLHDDIATLFSADTVDRAAVEKLRGQVTALVDQGSQVFSKALLDASQVLNAEQRQALVKHIQEQHGHRHSHF